MRGYYERFWNELESAKGEGRETWTKFYKPVIGMLAAAREPVSVQWIGQILGLDPEEVADFALSRWQKFLYRSGALEGPKWRTYHASFRDFLAEKLESARRYHALIAEHYRTTCDGDWRALGAVDDGYGLRHLPAHLVAEERWDDAATLLADYRFIRAKVEARLLNGLLADYDLAVATLPVGREPHVLELVQGALRLSAHVLARDTTQLPSQLTGRMLARRESDIQQLLEQTRRETTAPCLYPISATLDAPGGLLLRTLTGLGAVYAVAMTSEGCLAVSNAAENTLKVWNLTTDKEVRTLAGHTPQVIAVAVTPDGRLAVSGSTDGTLKMWDMSTGVEARTLAACRRERLPVGANLW